MEAKTLALYLGCQITAFTDGANIVATFTGIELDARDDHSFITAYPIGSVEPRHFRAFQIKPHLRPLSSMTEEDFKSFAEDFFNSKNLVFASQDKYWYACRRELDPDYEGTPMEYINDAGDDDPENVLMCSTISKLVTYGWIIYEELYHGFSMEQQSEVIRHFLSKHFDLFGLIESGQALDISKLK